MQSSTCMVVGWTKFKRNSEKENGERATEREIDENEVKS